MGGNSMREVNPWRVALSIFLYSGAFFGIGMAVVHGPEDGSWFAYALWTGIPFGLLMATFAGGLHFIVGRRLGNGKTPHVFQTADVVVDLEASAAVAAAESAMRCIDIRRLKTFSDVPVRIVARTHTSWKSWGERIEVVITQAGDNRALVRIQSRPLVRLTVVDYGKGVDNVNRIVTALRSLSLCQSSRV
jgi:hypothetical protein